MASKIVGRDINGMRAAGWSQPNLAGFQNIKVSPKCSNAELLEAIKSIVAQSVFALRGIAADDKYRNIVDMLMLRVRGALAETIKELESNEVDIDTSEIAENVSEAAIELIQEKIDPKNGLILIDKSNLQQLVDTIVEAISTKSQKEQQPEESTKEQTQQETENVIVEKTIEKNETKTIEKTQVTTASPTQVAQVDVTQSISLDDINKLQAELDKNFKKIESLIQSNGVEPQKQLEAQSGAARVETTIVQTIVTVEKTAEESGKKLEEKTSTPSAKVEEKVEAPKDKGKVNDVLTNRQFSELLKMLAKCQTATVNLIGLAIESTNKQFEDLNEQLEKIWKHLNKSKISWLAILAGISLILLPLFWDKIKGFFTWLNEEFHIGDIINKFINSIDWGKHVGKVTGFIWDAVKKKFMDFIQNPMGFIVNKFTTAYTAITTWTKDIWSWVKEKLSWTKEKQDENEAKAEKESTEKFQAAIDNLEQHTSANVQQVQESANAACEDTTSSIATKTGEISNQVEQMQQTAGEQITSTTDAVRESTDEINGTILPGMDKDLQGAVDNAGAKVESRADTAITASESKLNDAMTDLDKKMADNGAPTSVSKETLAKMDAAGEGSNISSGSIDQKVEGPKTVVQTTSEEQGKTVQLYSKKEDVDRAASENKEVNQLIGNVNGMGQNVTNVTVDESKTQTNVQNKILVNAGGNPVEREAQTYENMHVTINEVSKNSAIIEDGLAKSTSLLGSLKEKVNDYFEELNSLVKALKDKPPAQHNNNVVVMDSGNSASHNSAQMAEF